MSDYKKGDEVRRAIALRLGWTEIRDNGYGTPIGVRPGNPDPFPQDLPRFTTDLATALDLWWEFYGVSLVQDAGNWWFNSPSKTLDCKSLKHAPLIIAREWLRYQEEKDEQPRRSNNPKISE